LVGPHLREIISNLHPSFAQDVFPLLFVPLRIIENPQPNVQVLGGKFIPISSGIPELHTWLRF